MDCHALLEILQSERPTSEGRVFKSLLDMAYTQDLKIFALNAPFESKDKLKNRGYRWDAERKTWYTTVIEADLESEANWLRQEVYDGRLFKLSQEIIDAYNRFSNRRGVVEGWVIKIMAFSFIVRLPYTKANFGQNLIFSTIF